MVGRDSCIVETCWIVKKHSWERRLSLKKYTAFSPNSLIIKIDLEIWSMKTQKLLVNEKNLELLKMIKL